jgi:trimeric autotransporter adhesin
LETGSLTGTIPAGGSVTIRTAGLGAQTIGGWAELTAPASVGGSVIYSQKTGLPSIQEGTATIVAAGSQHFFLPFDNTAGGATGVAVTNPGASVANISVVLRYSDGTSETVAYPALAARNHQAFLLAGQYPNTANRTGVAEFTSNVALSAVVFRSNSTGAFTSFGIVAP